MTTLTTYQQKALKLDKHIALTANAGSGKTFVLAKRFLKIILDEKIPIKKIVAITFTDKAAGELYNKISKQIESELINEADLSKKYRLKKIREQLVSANISTIHSFCLNVLKEFAPEANLDASFLPIDKETSNEILDLAVEESFQEIINDYEKSTSLKNCVRIIGSKSNLIKQLKQLVNKRRSFLKMKNDFLNKSIDELKEHQISLFDKYFGSIFLLDENKLIKRISVFNKDVSVSNPKNKISDQISELLERLDQQSLTKIGRLQTYQELFNVMLTNKSQIRQQGYAPKEILESNLELNELLSEQAKIISKFDLVNPEAVFKNYSKFIKDITIVLDSVISKYSLMKKEKGFIDFEDILLFTEKVLEHEEVTQKLKEKYSYIMIDEFQDTNEIQINIFLPILENLNKGNLFVVGDEKQSIYMFREAEIGIFNETKKMISEIDGKENLLNLPHSFRLSKEIAFFSNHLFSHLFRNYDSSFNEVQYNELVYFDKGENPNSKIEILVSNQTEEVFYTQPELICSKIAELINVEKVELNKIAILCRKRIDFTELEKELIKQQIPYTIIGGRGFYQRQLVLDLYNYLSFLINQNNDAALLAVLRSPFYALDDSQIFLLSFQKGNNLFEKLKTFAKSNYDFEKVISILQDHIDFVSQNRLSELLRRIFNDTAYTSVIINRINSKQELANIDKLFEVAQSYINQGFRSLYDFVNYLNDSIQLSEDEGQAEVSASENSIKIMTIHQSKGLEFDAVFLFNLQTKFNLTNVKAKDIDFDKEFGFITKIPLDNYFDEYKSPVNISVYGNIIKRKEIAEQKRLLYVAVTRAAKYLFLCYDDNGKISEDSFAGMLKSVFPSLSTFTPIKLDGSLRKMFKKNDSFDEEDIPISIDLEIFTKAEDQKLILRNENNVENKFEINTEKLLDKSKGEVITASQYAVYNNCPVKYQLIYELGINEISEMLPSKVNYEYYDNDTPQTGSERGTIVHHLLAYDTPKQYLKQTAESKFKSADNIIEESIRLVENFYSSDIYNSLMKSGDHFNEYELYSEFEDIYLHGYIDKLIIDNSGGILVDYKTDNINESNITSKIELYKNQLMFYAKMIFDRFPKVQEVEIKLIFLNDLSKSYSEVVKRNSDALHELEKNLQKLIDSVRERKYNFNKLNCGNCQFFINKKCIKENQIDEKDSTL
jgi:ATP-dependent helicase/nuclease subunit A